MFAQINWRLMDASGVRWVLAIPLTVIYSSTARCDKVRPGKYYHYHTNFSCKASLLCSSLKGMGAEVISDI